MWRKQDEPKPAPPATPLVVSPAPEQPSTLAAEPMEPGAATGRVSKAIVIKGEISGEEDLFIDGEVQGSIRLRDGIVTIGPNGRVTADIDAAEIVVRGRVKGALRGRDRVHIGCSAQAAGDVVTRRVAIEEGAIFRGKIEVVGGEEAGDSRTAAAATGTEALRPVAASAKQSQS